jgi:hypothetical protein
MLIYSFEIFKFIEKIIRFTKEILTKEMRVKVVGSRFLNEEKTHSFPISITIFTSSCKLAYFDPTFLELGFNERLLLSLDDILKDIIRHELAHYFTFIKCGLTATAHGDEFLSTCKKYHFSEQVSRATLCEKKLDGAENKESEISRKIKKLLALGSSSNTFEAEAAMIKAQTLLTHHHLVNVEINSEAKIYLKKILLQKRQSPKLRAIAKIVETFFVNTIFKSGSGVLALEIIGSKENVEIGEYVAIFLNSELEHLWNNTKKQNHCLSGLRDKNSFFLGVAKGYCKKVGAFKKSLNPSTSHGLITLERSLVNFTRQIYPKLHMLKTEHKFSKQATFLGESAGQNLVIKPAISDNNSSIKNLTAGIPFVK